MANYTKNTKRESIITDVTVHKIKNGGKLLAFASVVIADSLVISGIKIYQGKDNEFISMPSNKGTDGEYHDITFPITKEFRTELFETILDEYNK